MKLPFSFDLKTLFRMLLPGIVLGFALLPVIKVFTAAFLPGTPAINVFPLASIGLGWLFVVMDMQIYMIFEGRRFWPRSLWSYFHKKEQARCEDLFDTVMKTHGRDNRAFVEASVEVRRFPIDDHGDFCARFPTRLGNLLAAFEDYPNRIYGMDSVFYWYRIWLVIDHQLRELLDQRQALADSTLYTATALYISGAIYLAYLLPAGFGRGTSVLPGNGALVSISVLCLLAGFLLYRTSLHLHASYGELFKALFDIHRDKVKVDGIVEIVAELIENPTLTEATQKEKYDIAWRYLHNYRVTIGNESVVVPKAHWKLQKHRAVEKHKTGEGG